MADELRSVLQSLVGLAEVDASIARLKAERGKWEEERVSRSAQHESIKADADSARLAYLERKQKYEKEEKHLKHQQDKLVDRRKALTSLSNYKLQQAAEKEIDATSRSLSAQEDLLIKMLGEVEELEAVHNQTAEAFEASEKELQSFLEEFESETSAIDERLEEKLKTSEEERKSIDPKYMRFYNKASAAYPANPVVPFTANSCGGCHMQLGPQTGVEISRAEKLITCRQCSRILYIDRSDSE